MADFINELAAFGGRKECCNHCLSVTVQLDPCIFSVDLFLTLSEKHQTMVDLIV